MTTFLFFVGTNHCLNQLDVVFFITFVLVDNETKFSSLISCSIWSNVVGFRMTNILKFCFKHSNGEVIMSLVHVQFYSFVLFKQYFQHLILSSHYFSDDEFWMFNWIITPFLLV